MFTIVTSVPRAVRQVHRERLRDEVTFPDRQQPHQYPRGGRGDSRTRSRRRGIDGGPLADPDLPKTKPVTRTIITCIACNRLPRSRVRRKKVSCLLNPRAGRETTLTLGPTRRAGGSR